MYLCLMAVFIKGTGSYIPQKVVSNAFFHKATFYNEKGQRIEKSSEQIVEKFGDITGIRTRRYVEKDQVASDIAFLAAQKAIVHAGINPEDLDYVVVAHNFGDIQEGSVQGEQVPSLAARVKHHLGIQKRTCIAYDIVFGCPGWLEATIQCIHFLENGRGRYALVIGAETLSRIADPHDRDRMLYGDGAGATILEKKASSQGGFLHTISLSDTQQEIHYLKMAPSYNPQVPQQERYLKMQGRKVYEYALKKVPEAIATLLKEAGESLQNIKMLLLHQANPRMNHAIVQRLLRLFQLKEPPYPHFAPTTVDFLGNTSVATIPTLLDLILKKELPPYELRSGDKIIMASVGAGMNINAALYQMP